MNTIWNSNGAKIVRHFEGCYSLIYRGIQVMPATTFDVVSRYAWAEFIPNRTASA